MGYTSVKPDSDPWRAFRFTQQQLKERCKYQQGSKPNDDLSSQTAVIAVPRLDSQACFRARENGQALSQGASLPTPDPATLKVFMATSNHEANALGIEADRP